MDKTQKSGRSLQERAPKDHGFITVVLKNGFIANVKKSDIDRDFQRENSGR